MASVRQSPHSATVLVETGPIPEVFATGVLQIEQQTHFVRITLVEDHPWGGPHGPERHIKLRLILTPEGLAELTRQIAMLQAAMN